MDQAALKKTLQELVKGNPANKICNDCSNPNPQWASLSFAVFICLQCAGLHRSFGVHISFVRSISMDTWQEDQVKRMQLGGNAPFREFMRNYSPAEQGGYKDSLSPHDTYHCWAATQYREKLDAALAGKDWSPSAPPANFMTPERPSSAQGLRKSRTSSRAMAGSSLRSDSASPASFRNSSPRGTPDLSSGDRKTANESYFATLGEANANRPDHLPPSQGGRYQGFGNTPSPSQHPSYGMSSASAPTLGDLQENPMAALTKGWSLFSSAVIGASKVVNDAVIQPGMEKLSDPAFTGQVKGYISEAQKRATDIGSAANQWSKNSLGVDVADSVGGVVDKFSGGPARAGYGSLAAGYDNESSGFYHDHDDDDDWGGGRGQTYHGGGDNLQPAQLTPVGDSSSTAPPAKKKANNDWDDEWKDF